MLTTRVSAKVLANLINLTTHPDFQILVDHLRTEQAHELRALLGSTDQAATFRAQGRCQLLDELLTLMTNPRTLRATREARAEASQGGIP